MMLTMMMKERTHGLGLRYKNNPTVIMDFERYDEFREIMLGRKGIIMKFELNHQIPLFNKRNLLLSRLEVHLLRISTLAQASFCMCERRKCKKMDGNI